MKRVVFGLFLFLLIPCFYLLGQDEGQKISVQFENADIRAVLKEVSSKASISIVVPEGIQGNVSVKFTDVPWRIVLRSVLNAVGYGYQADDMDERVITIRKSDEILETAVIRVMHASVADIRSSIEQFVSEVGKIQEDSRSNSIIITDKADYVRKARSVIKQLDSAIPQIMIEAMVIETSLENGSKIGVDWQSLAGYRIGVKPNAGAAYDLWKYDTNNNSYSANTNHDPSTLISSDGRTISDSASTLGLLNFGPDSIYAVQQAIGWFGGGGGGGPTPEQVDIVAKGINDFSLGPSSKGSDVRNWNNYAVSHPQSNGNLATRNTKGELTTNHYFASAILDADTFNVVLSALEQTGDMNVLSNPQIVTTENREATILVGEQFPIADFVFNPETATLEVKGFEYMDIGISLRVTPRIVGGDSVLMDVNPEISDEGQPVVFGGATGTLIPRIQTQEARTRVMVKDGSTLVIGGLIREVEVKSVKKVPLLGSIPLVGMLFSSHGTQKVKRELMIFITPHILNDGNYEAITRMKMNHVMPPQHPFDSPGVLQAKTALQPEGIIHPPHPAVPVGPCQKVVGVKQPMCATVQKTETVVVGTDAEKKSEGELNKGYLYNKKTE